MKKAFLILFGFLGLESAVAQKGQQVVGFQLGTLMGTDGLHFGSGFEPEFLSSGGIYYNLNFNRRFGMNTSLLYQHFVDKNIHSFYPIGIYYKNVFSNLELPVSLTLNLDKKDNIAWKTYFTLGYAYNYIIKYKEVNLQNGQRKVYSRDYYGNSFDGHFVTAGIEIRHSFNNRYLLSINPNARFSLNTSYLSNEGYLGLNLKFGRIL